MKDDKDVVLATVSTKNKNKTHDGWALYYASYKGHTDVVNLLLQQKNLKINQQSKGGGKTALHTASRWGHIEIIKLLLNQTDEIESICKLCFQAIENNKKNSNFNKRWRLCRFKYCN